VPGPAQTDSSNTEPAPSADAEEASDPSALDAPTATAPEDPREATGTPLTKLASRANRMLSSLTRAAERGIAINTGGALLSRKAQPDKSGDPVETDGADPDNSEAVDPADTKPAAKKSSAKPSSEPVKNFVRSLPVGMPAGAERSVMTAIPRGTEDVRKTVVQPATTALESTQLRMLPANKTDPAVAWAVTAAQAPLERHTVSTVLSSLVSAFGFGGLASDTPDAPIGTPVVMALLALGVRREESMSTLSKTANVSSSPVAALTLTGAPAAALAPSDPATSYPVTPVAVSANTWIITKVTGPGGLNDTPARFGIGGTDLGIMWDNGIRADNLATQVVEQRQVLVAFGDTFAGFVEPRTGDWKINTLLRSSDTMLSNGMYVRNGVPGDIFSGSPLTPSTVPSIASPGYAMGPEVTIIPTSGISAPYPNQIGSRQYVSFMSIRSWDTPGSWTTNYSGIAYSDDNGQTWQVAPGSIRPAAALRSTRPFVSGNQNFQQSAFVKPPVGSPDAVAGYVYAYGTPSGRGGTVYLSRVKQDQILDQTKYEYWNGSSWSLNKPSAATPILPGKTTSFFGFFKSTTYPSVSEMSVQYN
jgi:hypothetical protein